MRHPLRHILPAAVLSLLPAVPVLGEIFYAPAQPNVEQSVSFSVTSTSIIQTGSIVWKFGDGGTAAGVATIAHTYLTAGAMKVEVDYLRFDAAFGGAIPVHEEKIVQVVERRSITANPAQVGHNQTITFTALNFLSTSVLWDFGDGSAPRTAGTTTYYVYSFPGSYTISARDFGGKGTVVFRTTVLFGPDYGRRSIQAVPARPMPLQPVTFTAVAFFSADIRWDFGDGTPPVSGKAVATHVFARAGTYLVQAWDYDGKSGPPVSLPLTVEEPLGPRAAFGIFFLQLRFEDGLAYKVVPRGFPSLTAWVDIKYEGTGLFQAQWLVDGMPFQVVTQALTFADSTTLNSGRIPGLPTQIPGMHEVSLRILRPEAGITVPVIRYFVTAGTERPALSGLSLRIEEAEGLKGAECSLDLNRLRVPEGSYFILNGSIASTASEPVKIGLLRLHMAGELVDQQILRDLRAGEKRAFATSIRNPSPGGGPLYITLYDITDPKAPRLLHLRKIEVLPGG